MGTMVMREQRLSGTDEGTSLTQQKAMIEKFCWPIVGRGGRKGRQTGQVLPVRPIRVADLSGDDDDDRSLWRKKHPRPRPKARTASLDANMQPCRLIYPRQDLRWTCFAPSKWQQ